MAGKDKKSKGEGDVEQGVVALAQQIGWFLGKVQKRADGWLENETLQKQVTQMRDGAIELLGHVTRAGSQAREAVSNAVDAAKAAAAESDKAANQAVATRPAVKPSPKARAAAKPASKARKAAKPAAKAAVKAKASASKKAAKKTQKP